MNLVSIIIPCYNYGWVLPETLESVTLQTYSNWECIVVDDGSTDNTRTAVENFAQHDSRFIYVYQQKNGISSARNKGLSVAKGIYIQFLDADDMLAKKKLELQVKSLINDSSLDIIYSDVRFFESSNPSNLKTNYNMRNADWMPKVSGQSDIVLKYLVEGNIMVMNAPLIKAELLEKVGGFDENLKVMEDWYYWICCAIHNARFYFDERPDTWALVRVHETSISKNRVQMYIYEERIRSRMLDTTKDKAIKSINDSKIVLLSGIIAQDYMAKKNIWKGLAYFAKAAKYSGNYIHYLKNFLYWTKKVLSS